IRTGRCTKDTADGTSVNLDGRIESFTMGGQVLVSEDTLEKIKATLRIDGQFEVEPKGASRRLLLYEVGGIGEPFDLWLPPKTKPLRPLAPPLPVQFTVLEEKFVGRTVHDGYMRVLTGLEASIRASLPVARLSNVRT